MNASAAADWPVMDKGERGKDIERRRLRIGIKSIRAFAEATGIARSALTAAEKGEGTELTYKRVEAWLDDHEEQMGMDDLPGDDAPADDHSTVSITMSGVHGIKDVVISGPVDHLDELKRLAVELLREVRGND